MGGIISNGKYNEYNGISKENNIYTIKKTFKGNIKRYFRSKGLIATCLQSDGSLSIYETKNNNFFLSICISLFIVILSICIIIYLIL